MKGGDLAPLLSEAEQSAGPARRKEGTSRLLRKRGWTLSEVVTISDGTPAGTFAQIRLDDGKRVLISMTQTEVAVFKLFVGSIPVGTVYKAAIHPVIQQLSENPRFQQMSTPLEDFVKIVLECGSIREIPAAIKLALAGG